MTENTEQYFVENPDKLREVIVSLIEAISSEWMTFEQNDPRPRILLRYLFIYYELPFNGFSRKDFLCQFDELMTEIAMYISGWQGDIIKLPPFLKD